ncbi:hypothetical protein [Sphingobacterium thalpophilum]|uniref:hypothetical protein n=1 Tax=Sphingobacterium thalpophilum TaxID=259 RepID=UPI003D9631E2
METSEQLCERIAEIANGIAIVSFSMGKDSIAAYIQMKKYFDRIYPVFYYMVPDLEFQNKSLEYYENEVFKERILRFPSPALYRQLAYFMYQHPNAVDFIHEKDIYIPHYDEVFAAAKMDLDLDIGTYTGVGVRMNDSLNRRFSIKKYGAVNEKRSQFYPVFDWSNDKLITEIRASGIKLPIDYRIWGRTFDGFHYKFLKPLKDHFPNDYEKCKTLYPFLDLELIRHEQN